MKQKIHNHVLKNFLNQLEKGGGVGGTVVIITTLKSTIGANTLITTTTTMGSSPCEIRENFEKQESKMMKELFYYLHIRRMYQN